jgi:hypothetical protein
MAGQPELRRDWQSLERDCLLARAQMAQRRGPEEEPLASGHGAPLEMVKL